MAPEPSTARLLVQEPVASMPTASLTTHIQSHTAFCVCPTISTHLSSNSEIACSDSNCSSRYIDQDNTALSFTHACLICGSVNMAATFATRSTRVHVTFVCRRSLPHIISDATIRCYIFHPTASEPTNAVFIFQQVFCLLRRILKLLLHRVLEELECSLQQKATVTVYDDTNKKIQRSNCQSCSQAKLAAVNGVVVMSSQMFMYFASCPDVKLDPLDALQTRGLKTARNGTGIQVMLQMRLERSTDDARSFMIDITATT